MRRLFLLLSLWLIAFTPAHATLSALQEGKQETTKAELPNVKELEKLIKTIENKSSRRELVENLRTLIKAQRKIEADDAQQNIFLLTLISDSLRFLTLKVATVFDELDALVNDFLANMHNQVYRNRLFDGLGYIVIVLGAGFLAEKGAYYSLRPLRLRLMRQTYRKQAIRVKALMMRGAFDVIGMIVFAAATFTVMRFLDLDPVLKAVTFIMAVGALILYFVLSLLRLLFYPQRRYLRLLHLEDDTAKVCYGYGRLLAVLLTFGIALHDIIFALQGPKSLFILVHKSMILLCCFVRFGFLMNVREKVKKTLLQQLRERYPTQAKGRKSFMTRLVETWHLWVGLYIFVFAITSLYQEAEDLRAFLSSFLGTAGLAALAYVMIIKIPAFMKRFITFTSAPFPHIRARQEFYITFSTLFINISLVLFIFYLADHLWSLELFDEWLMVGDRSLVSILSTSLVIIILAIIVWEICEYLIDKNFLHHQKEFSVEVRRKRLLTILPLVRNLTRFVVFAVFILILFAELGMDITPLLAGAGVLGLALSLGGQALVKDIITGIFILIEDTINVGDLIQVDSGKRGNVEALSLRAVKLRDSEGFLHTIPFSSISIITNMTKHYAYYVLDLTLTYDTDVDQVVPLVMQVNDELRQKEKFRDLILEPMEVLGVDRFEENGFVLRARIKTTPTSRWLVGREVNRMIKKIFDDHQITFATGAKMIEVKSDGVRVTV
ncbi:MAG: mechanosensitive ion channel domain-containing protein [Holosporales bacterium]